MTYRLNESEMKRAIEEVKWISIATDLPPKGVRVLCKLAHSIGFGVDRKVLYRMKHNGKWNDYHHLVTHWTPHRK